MLIKVKKKEEKKELQKSRTARAQSQHICNYVFMIVEVLWSTLSQAYQVCLVRKSNNKPPKMNINPIGIPAAIRGVTFS